ncbi:FmdB family transcriptional regulator [Georgenia sp. TF02-10]|uniref:FmdB family zinc ribbon protein n=1 Tax=Georgenia sp. TF02-10 TaxID=2917725 RepID=UPI001FA7E515|nr:FmdB family zinc ribbon protein [Georgenia sp. TF02-10]UNX55453.1 FmdB family transcriptional regulator [Georgenia sp. TF02-10]
MPTYAYRCTVCGNELEAKQSFTDAALTVCPECGGALRKLFSSVGVVFKGSGFYRTDSRASSGSGSSSSAKEPAASTSSSGAKEPAGASTSATSGSNGSAGAAKSSSTKPASSAAAD